MSSEHFNFNKALSTKSTSSSTESNEIFLTGNTNNHGFVFVYKDMWTEFDVYLILLHGYILHKDTVDLYHKSIKSVTKKQTVIIVCNDTCVRVYSSKYFNEQTSIFNLVLFSKQIRTTIGTQHWDNHHTA